VHGKSVVYEKLAAANGAKVTFFRHSVGKKFSPAVV
jgi:hypothetical protein